MKTPAIIALLLVAGSLNVEPAQSQTCVGACAGDNRHELFIEREYRDFLLQRYPNYGARYYGRRPDISIGPGATVGGPLPGTVGRMRRGPPRTEYDINAHLRWCQERYVSYRADDNTYQPFKGLRRSCNSPYN